MSEFSCLTSRSSSKHWNEYNKYRLEKRKAWRECSSSIKKLDIIEEKEVEINEKTRIEKRTAADQNSEKKRKENKKIESSEVMEAC